MTHAALVWFRRGLRDFDHAAARACTLERYGGLRAS